MGTSRPKTQGGISRREFLSRTAAGAGVLTASSLGLTRFVWAAPKPIVLGLHADLTGVAATYGYWFQKVVKAAVDKVNAEGGIDGREVRLVVADTASSAETGPRNLRQLIYQDEADFVIGSVHSGVVLASAPVAQETNTFYFSGGAMSASITGEKASPYLGRCHTHARMQAQVGWKWAFDNLGRKWTFVVADYAWGRSLAQEFGARIKAAGGEVQVIKAPPRTSDFIPYLQKVHGDSEVLFTAFLGSAALGVMRQSVEIGLHERMKRYSVICTADGIGIDQIGKEAVGMHFLSYHPRYLDQVPEAQRPFEAAFRRAVGVTPDGRDVGNPKKVIVGSHYWSGWEYVGLIKQAVESSGWKSKKDNRAFRNAFFTLKVQAGPWFPQGDLEMRAADQQGFHNHYLVRVDPDLKLRRIAVLPKERAIYEPPVNLDAKWT